MLECEFKPEEETHLKKPIEQPKNEIEPVTPKLEPQEITKVKEENDSWLDFFSKDTTEVNVEEMLVKNIKNEPEANETEVETEAETEAEIEPETVVEAETEVKDNNHIANKKRIMKYMDPTTRKIYYLEMDEKFDVSKVREIVINSQNKNGVKNKKVSLLKPEVKQQLKAERRELSHIENDHCYLKSNVSWFNPVQVKESYVDNLKKVVTKFTSVRMIVNYLLKKLPLISDNDSVSDKSVPFMVDSEDKYWRVDFTKRRNMEVIFFSFILRLLCSRIHRGNLVLSHFMGICGLNGRTQRSSLFVYIFKVLFHTFRKHKILNIAEFDLASLGNQTRENTI